MSIKKPFIRHSTHPSRRDFLKGAALVATSAGLSAFSAQASRGAHAANRDHILIGLPNPSTGALADFGAGTPWANERALAAVNGDGGVFLRDRGAKLPVKIKVVDTESDPTRAGEVAARLILHDRVDLMLVMHTPDTVNPVCAMCERYEVPCISLDAPIESWLTGGPYRWCWHAFWTVDALTDLYIGMWEKQAADTNRTVGGFWPNDADGTEWSSVFKKKLPGKGFTVIDPGRFPFFMRDYAGVISQFKKEKADIVTGVVIPPDWSTAWRQCRRHDFIPKIATIGKAILFPAAVNAIGGDLPLGLTCEVWWSPHHPFRSSLSNETARELCDAWTQVTGKQWTQPLGFKYAGIELAVDVLKRARSLEKEAIREAVSRTELSTIVGKIAYNERNYAETPLVGGQWVKGGDWPWELRIVYNHAHPEIPRTGEMMFPIPQ
jgi:branched-chain amino acid transport system substrate-binding protein